MIDVYKRQASSIFNTAKRTNWHPELAKSLICLTVASMSLVLVLVIDWIMT